MLAGDYSSSQLGSITLCGERPGHIFNHKVPELKFSLFMQRQFVKGVLIA